MRWVGGIRVEDVRIAHISFRLQIKTTMTGLFQKAFYKTQDQEKQTTNDRMSLECVFLFAKHETTRNTKLPRLYVFLTRRKRDHQKPNYHDWVSPECFFRTTRPRKSKQPRLDLPNICLFSKMRPAKNNLPRLDCPRRSLFTT